MTLYEMSERAAKLYALLEEEEIDNQTLEDTLECMGAKEKLENYVYVQKQLESDLLAYKKERERLEGKIKTCQNNIEKIKHAILTFMIFSGFKKAKAGTFDLSMGSTEKVMVTDQSKIPKELFVEQAPKINLISLKKILKGGGKVPGAELTKTEYVKIR